LTEQRNPRSRGLQKKSIQQLVDLFIAEERYVERALAAQRIQMARACRLVAQHLERNGRLFYVGAGTSGRLGVVDASEMPPTFNAPPEQVQAIMAGGAAAVFQSQEGAEDDREAGTRAVVERGVRKGDVVCGIAASGQTAFVLAALEQAKESRASTILLTCNPLRPPVKFADVTIDLPTGPEIVTGSTRLKAGTATKVALNILSTIAMIRLGHVRDNFMIDVQATNGKLRLRALELVMTLTGCGQDRAHAVLSKHGWNVRRSVEKLEI
jgi:N-acetylmuramic acid 6-phosphate etherase